MESKILYEDVQKAIQSLIHKKQKVTQANIRNELGQKGSLTTIHKYYTKWKNEKFIENCNFDSLSESTKNQILNKLENKVEDQDFLLDQTRKRNTELEQRLNLLEQENNRLTTANSDLELKLKNKQAEIAKQNLEIEKLETILLEIKFEHQSHIKFLENSLEKITSMHKASIEEWRERQQVLYEKHQVEVIDYQNKIQGLKQMQVSNKNGSNNAATIDSLVRDIGKLKMELKTKNQKISELEKL